MLVVDAVSQCLPLADTNHQTPPTSDYCAAVDPSDVVCFIFTGGTVRTKIVEVTHRTRYAEAGLEDHQDHPIVLRYLRYCRLSSPHVWLLWGTTVRKSLLIDYGILRLLLFCEHKLELDVGWA